MTTAAAKKTTTPEFETDADVQVTPSDWEFETVREESPIGVVFEKPGEQFIGRFERKHIVNREPNAKGEDTSFTLFVFTGRDQRPYGLPSSFALEEAYENDVFKVGDWVRITYIKDIDRGVGKNAMKDLRIDIRK